MNIGPSTYSTLPSLQDGWVLIPAYHEESVIYGVVSELVSAGYQVLVIDDGSEDKTGSEASRAGATVIRHGINIGQGAALETGMEWARRQAASWVVHFDADGQHSSADIVTMLSLLSTHDVVLGSRFLDGSSSPGMRKSRRVLLYLARALQNMVTGVKLTDAHCGLRALNSYALDKLRLTENGMSHATEIVSLIRQHHLSVVEAPVTIHYTSYSMAKGQSFWGAFRIIQALILRRLL